MTFQVRNAASIKRMTRSRGSLHRAVMETLENRLLLSGNGLLAQYYNGNSLTGTGITRDDPTVDFNWSNGAPDNSMPVDGYSAQWTGQILPLYSEVYTFTITAQGGALLSVNGTTLINQLTSTSGTWSGNIALTAGTKYAISVQYVEKNATNSGITLSWASNSQASQIIPQSQLYSFNDTDVGTNYAGNSSYDPTTGTLSISGGSKTESWMVPFNLGHFVTQTITGDVQIVARVISASADAYAGITIQDGLTSDATGIRVYRTNTGGIYTGGFDGIVTTTQPYWMKIVRIGNTFTAYGSTDGLNWQIAPSGTGKVLSTGAALNVGFFVASNVTNSATLESATFDNISISSPQAVFTTSWVGNSGSGIDAKHVANDIKGMYVAADGTIYANSPYDEGGYEAAVYKNGQIIGILQDINGGGSLHGWGRCGGWGIAVDDNYIYITMGQGPEPGASYPAINTAWNCIRRYSRSTLRAAPFTGGMVDGSVLVVNTVTGTYNYDATPATGFLRGLWVSGGFLFVSDKEVNLVKVYSTTDMSFQYSFAVNAPQQITEDGSGNLWIISNPDTGTPSILSYSKAGVLLSKSITDVVAPTSIALNPVNGQLLVSDDGPSQQVYSYNISGTTPTRVSTLGDYGGISSGTPGQVTATKFDNPMTVGADSSGNIYVTFDGMHPSITSAIGIGLVVRSFTPTGTLNWELHGLEFVDCAVIDPTSDGTTLFTKDEQWTLNYNTSGTEMGTWVGRTVDELVYTGDGRITGSDTNVMMVVLCGQKFLFTSGQSGINWNIYKQVAGTYLWKLCGGIGPSSMWRDLNNNATQDASENINITNSSLAYNGYIDSQGNFWFPAFYSGVYKAQFLGLDANGNPLYSTDYTKVDTSGTPFTQFGRVIYVPETDTMYMEGFTNAYPNPGEDPRGAGPVIIRYDNWSTSPTLTWQYVMPTDRTMNDVYVGNCTNSLALAGNRLFISIVGTANCYALDATTGQLVTVLYRGPEIGGQGGWLDQIQSIMAYRRSNGEYVITAEDDLLSKIIIYRAGGITPTNLTATTVAAGQITLSWTDTNNKENNYVIQQSTDGVNFTTLATLPANMTNYGISGLATGTTYYFRVKATNSFDDSPYTSPVQVLFQVTTAPTNVVTTGGTGQVVLSWTDNATSETAYKIERATNPAFTQNLTTLTFAANTTSYTDTNLPAAVTYYYRVYAVNGTTNLGYSRTVTGTTNVITPNAPSGIQVLPVTSSSLAINWRDNSNNETGFKLERATDSNFTQNLVQVGTLLPGATSFTDSGLATNSTYYYRVRAYNSAGNSGYSLAASGRTVGNATQLTGTPIGTPGTTYYGGTSPANAFDGDFNTFVDDANGNGWVGLDFGSAKQITAVSIAPRATWASRLVWGQFQVSNVADFSTATTIYTNMATLPENTLTTINVNVGGTWRYARFLTSGGYANVSELQFWGNSVTTAPTGVTLNSGSDTGTPGDNITSLNNSNSGQQLGFTVTGTISGATVYVLANGQVIGTTVASGSSTTVTTDGVTNLADGTYNITAQQVVPGQLASVISTATSLTILSAPVAPVGLSAAAASTTQVNLTWTAVSGVTSYSIYRSTTSGGEGTTALGTGISTTSYSDTGLAAGTTYYYKVAAANVAGTGTQSTEASAITVPAQATGLTATAASSTQINLAWSAVTGATTYNIYRSTTSGNEGTTAIATGISTTNYSNTGLLASTTYYYKVAAVNVGGTGAQSSEASASTQSGIPAQVTGLSATTASSTQINLSWSAVSGATTYNVYRSTTAGGEGSTAFATGISTTSYSNTSLSAGTTYYYKVAAVNGAGTGTQSAEASAITVPAQATGLTATAASSTQINLTWTGVAGATTYNIYRSTISGGEGTTAIATGISATNYSNTGLSASTTYYYKVAAVNAGGTGTQSTEASATTAATTPVKLTGTVIGTLGTSSGNPIANAFDGNVTTFFDAPLAAGWAGLNLGGSYTITTVKYAPRSGQESRMVNGYFQVSNIADFSTATTIYTITSTPTAGSLTSQTVSVSGTWQYIRYVGPSTGYCNVAELELWGTAATGSTAPVAPTTLTATTASATQINLAWVDNSSNETGFKIERATNTAFTQNLTLVTTTAANVTSYNDTGVTSGMRYYYRVRATNAVGDSLNCPYITALATVSSSLSGTVLTPSGATYYSPASNAFDGNLNTFVDSTAATGWVGLDLGSAKTITSIKFASRSSLEYRMIGGYFQVSNVADFSTATTIYTITGDAPISGSLTTINVNVSGTWRYVRYVSPTGGYTNISELQFWGY